jgi:type I restriction enzyme S subunit
MKLIVPTNNILQAFTKTVDTILTAKEAKRTENRTLAELRDTLLPRLINGELHVGDVDWEIGEV